MANISAVEIKGFQSHVESVFDLGPGLNVITGPSDAGKTAIIRAVRWVAFNEPTGEAYVNQSVGGAEVKLLLDSGQVITKRRRKGKTSYLIQQDQGDEGSLFEKAEVPEEVKHMLGINKQTFGDFETALNFAFQLDAPFLISETASAGAKVLGKLAGTEAVDVAVKAVNKDTVAARNERTQANREVERINGDLLKYADIDQAKEALDLAEMVVKQIEEQHEKGESLKKLHNDFTVLTGLLEAYQERLDKLTDLPALEEDLKNIEKAQKRYDTILDLFNRYNSLVLILEMLNSKLSSYSGVSVAADSLEVISENQDKLSLLNILLTDYTKYTEIVNKNSEKLTQMGDLEYAAEQLFFIENHKVGMLEEWKDLNAKYTHAVRNAEIAQDATERFKGISEAGTILNEVGVNSERLVHLRSIWGDFNTARTRSHVQKLNLEGAEENLTAANNELSFAWEATGGICPLCEQPHEGGAC